MQGNNQLSINLISTDVLKTESFVVTQDATLKEELSKFWNYETLSIKSEEPTLYDSFADQVKFKNGRYKVSLPFKEAHEVIPDNFSHCVQRLKANLKQLRNSPEILTQYHAVMKDQLNSGVIEPVDTEQVVESGTVHYLPHREVVRMNRKTTKLRVVFNASSKCPGEISLNDALYSGPNLLPLLFDILIRFRVHKVALTADIEKAFLIVSIKPEQRNMLRFLWIDSIELDDPCIVVYRFCRLVFGFISSPFVLGTAGRHHMSKYVEVDLEFVLELLRSLYVDDYASGADSVDSSFGLFEKLKKVFKEGGFNMRKWCSNDMKLMERIESVEKEQVARENNFHQSNKVLGILWDNEADLLRFDLEEVLINMNTDVLSKRMILSTTAKFFDPLGLTSPVILQLKILFQDICRAEINDWDQEVDGELKQRFMDIIEDIRHTKTILVNRCYFTTI